MIKHWQSMEDYKCFLHNSKISFDSSERSRLHSELRIPWQKLCLDSAMDNSPTYRIPKNRGIRAFIDLNDKCGRPKTIPDTITIDKDGTPLCQEKLRMKPNGYDRSSGYLMWRCPYGNRPSHLNHILTECAVNAHS